MSQYACTICGFIYDEEAGYPEGGISAGTLWADVPADFVCPLCGASKAEFTEKAKGVSSPTVSAPADAPVELPKDLNYSAAELSAVFSNLAKGCEKQYDPEMSMLYQQLSNYYGAQQHTEGKADFESVRQLLESDLSAGFAMANQVAGSEKDRGSQRALKWAEQVSRMVNAHLGKMNAGAADFLEDTNVYVCEICGFIYVGDEKPELCPICKVPNEKITQVGKAA
ncbi:MAG: rubredoxin [Deltaproteobacteria bacterium]|nr:rubredoxin [Deltaproteobacteria bacterium]